MTPTIEWLEWGWPLAADGACDTRAASDAELFAWSEGLGDLSDAEISAWFDGCGGHWNPARSGGWVPAPPFAGALVLRRLGPLEDRLGRGLVLALVERRPERASGRDYWRCVWFLLPPEWSEDLRAEDIGAASARILAHGALDAPLATTLLRAATAMLAREVAGADTLVIKTRSEDCRIWPLFDAAHPDARSLFLYRDAALVVQSFDRILGYPHGRSQALPDRDASFDRQLPAYEAALRTRFFARESPHLARAQRACGPWAGLLLAEWLDKVAAALDARERAAERVFPLRYEDLVAHPEAVLADVAGFLGHAWGGHGLPAGNSQAGTLLESVESHPHPLDEATVAGIGRVVREVLGERLS